MRKARPSAKVRPSVVFEEMPVAWLDNLRIVKRRIVENNEARFYSSERRLYGRKTSVAERLSTWGDAPAAQHLFEEFTMSISTPGTVALIGAGEYLPPIAAVDQVLLERVSGEPRVVVLPTAAALDGPGVVDRWAQMGVEHFSQLGATVEPVMLLNRADADNSKIVDQITTANFVYLSGGKPRYLLETLQGTLSWQAILNLLTAGGVVAGCSAGAMVLGSEVFDFPQVWRTIPALGVVPGIAVIPHFDEIPALMTNTMIRSKRRVTIVGIDGSTALIQSNAHWTVLGRGGVTVFTGKQKRRYLAGDQIALPD